MASSIKQFEHLKIQIEAIMSATNDFSDGNRIGKGGFGEVYNGELVQNEGQPMVAFKRLNRAFGQGDPEFWKEIMMLSFYKHPNIVSLVGYCDDCGEKILVYEYAQKGSLDLYLDSDELSWIRRLKICIGAARGLAYLHSPTGNQLRVLHRDIKSSNILLDENWNAKISDFGLSKFGPANQQFTFLVSNPVGTFGYLDPLYVESGLLTKESDVYSFGVVLFEVLCGRLCIGNNINKHRPLIGLVRQCYKENKLQEIIYGKIKDEINPKSLETFTKIAYQCLKREREERPLMMEIVGALETALNYQKGTVSILLERSLLDVGEGSGGGQHFPDVKFGQFARSKKKVLEEILKEFDKDSEITIDELKALLQDIKFRNLTRRREKDVEEILKEFDKDGDRKISMDEFVDGFTKWLDETKMMNITESSSSRN